MTRLEKYLLATATEIIESETTISRYFVVGNIKVRVSDHLSSTSDADLQILIPTNGGTRYIVTIKESSTKFLVWNATQIKDFIPSLQIIKSLKEEIHLKPKPKESTVQRIQLALNNNDTSEGSLTFDGTIIESKLKINKLSSKQRKVLGKSKSTWDISEIGTLPIMLRADLKLQNGSVNEDMQIFLTCTSVTYKEILNIYKVIVVDNNMVPTIKLLQEAYALVMRQESSNGQDIRLSSVESQFESVLEYLATGSNPVGTTPAAKVVGVLFNTINNYENI